MSKIVWIACIALAACAGEELTVEETAQGINGGGCPMTVKTTGNRWYCQNFDGSPRQYWRFNNNAQIPAHTAVAVSGTLTQYNPSQPFKVTLGYTLNAPTFAGHGCPGDTGNALTQQTMTLSNGTTCTLDNFMYDYPGKRHLFWYCNDQSFVCSEHDGPRAFGGAAD